MKEGTASETEGSNFPLGLESVHKSKGELEKGHLEEGVTFGRGAAPGLGDLRAQGWQDGPECLCQGSH